MRKASLPLFLILALGLAWLVQVPTWLSGRGLEAPMFATYTGAMMFAPSVAVLVVWLFARRRGTTIRDLARDTGLALGPRKRRTLAVAGAFWIGIPLFIVLGLLVSAALGLYHLDFGLGLFRENMKDVPGGQSSLPPGTLALITLATIPLSPILNAIPCFGEEWGWRGFLMPRLLVYGRLRAILFSGIIWGLWHAPVTLLGYNYPNLGPWAAAMFIPFCVLFGAVLSWARLVTGSVWPAVIGHAALNGSSVLIVLGAAAGSQPSLVFAAPLGLVGMALLAALVIVLYRGTSTATLQLATGSDDTGNVMTRPDGVLADGR